MKFELLLIPFQNNEYDPDDPENRLLHNQVLVRVCAAVMLITVEYSFLSTFLHHDYRR